MNEPKFGEALARVMDRRDKLADHGYLDGYELGEILVVATFNKSYEGADPEIEQDAIETFILVDGTTQIPYVQLGVLEMAKDTCLNPL